MHIPTVLPAQREPILTHVLPTHLLARTSYSISPLALKALVLTQVVTASEEKATALQMLIQRCWAFSKKGLCICWDTQMKKAQPWSCTMLWKDPPYLWEGEFERVRMLGRRSPSTRTPHASVAKSPWKLICNDSKKLYFRRAISPSARGVYEQEPQERQAQTRQLSEPRLKSHRKNCHPTCTRRICKHLWVF